MKGRTPYRAFLDRIPANDNSKEDTDRKSDQADAADHRPRCGTVGRLPSQYNLLPQRR
jgi:hypothetical protein